MEKDLLKLSWIGYSMLAAVLSVFQVLIIKYLNTRNIGPAEMIIAGGILFLIFSVFLFIILNRKIKNYVPKFPMKYYIYILVAAILAFSSGYSYLKGIQIAPNPGYPMAILSFSYISVAILSYFIFGSDLNRKKVLGIIIVIFGLTLIVC
tara:strand:+ start:1051 stop:1500 length:450 start_codon:yes stop_codon:yes gene_type:complete